MNKFKLLTGFGFRLLRQAIMDKILEQCKEYSEYIDLCKADHLLYNPDDVGRDDYVFNIPYYRIEYDFIEGQLWHGGTDFDEEENKLYHYLFFDKRNRTHEDLYITVHETDDGEYIIINIEEDESRWI